MPTLEDVINEVSKDGRVCPKPQIWNQLWESLPNRKRKGAGYVPSAPLILGAWHYSSDDEKRERFHFHIRWADEHGELEKIASIINEMNDDDWHIEEK